MVTLCYRQNGVIHGTEPMTCPELATKVKN